MSSSMWTLAVWPDTQYLFDGERANPCAIRHTIEALPDLAPEGLEAIVHVGDVVEHGSVSEFEEARRAFDLSDTNYADVAQMWVCGNHDVDDDSDDTRGHSAFAENFGPSSWPGGYTVTVDPSGYSWIAQLPHAQVIGVGWRARTATLEWLRAHAHGRPTIVVTHDALFAGHMTGYGQLVWDYLCEPIEGVFLVLCGHEWPASSAVFTARDGREIIVSCLNFQERTAGGAGTIALVRIDAAQVKIDTYCPSLAADPTLASSPAAHRELGGIRESFPLSPRPQSPRLPLPPPDVTTRTRGYLEVPGVSSWLIHLRVTVRDWRSWQVLVARWGDAPDGSKEPLAQLSVSTEGFFGFHAYVEDGQVWATSHEVPPHVSHDVVVSLGGWRDGRHYEAGMWVDGFLVSRSNLRNPRRLIRRGNHGISSERVTKELWSMGFGKWGDREADFSSASPLELNMWKLSDLPNAH
ncbi:MAG: metallophosphoesterase [Actinomycetaceae bacterium]|nr:metallophosphoesterase [Actinomycetaceae bacterium]